MQTALKDIAIIMEAVPLQKIRDREAEETTKDSDLDSGIPTTSYDFENADQSSPLLTSFSLGSLALADTDLLRIVSSIPPCRPTTAAPPPPNSPKTHIQKA